MTTLLLCATHFGVMSPYANGALSAFKAYHLPSNRWGGSVHFTWYRRFNERHFSSLRIRYLLSSDPLQALERGYRSFLFLIPGYISLYSMYNVLPNKVTSAAHALVMGWTDQILSLSSRGFYSIKPLFQIFPAILSCSNLLVIPVIMDRDCAFPSPPVYYDDAEITARRALPYLPLHPTCLRTIACSSFFPNTRQPTRSTKCHRCAFPTLLSRTHNTPN